MSEKKPPAGADAKAADPKSAAAPAAPTESKITVLTEQLKQLEQSIRTIEGRIRNRDPKLTKALQQENAELLKKLSSLERALFAVLVDADLPRTAPEFQQRHVVLQQNAVEFFKQTKIDNELWKNIES
jgi:hypothetical protein